MRRPLRFSPWLVLALLVGCGGAVKVYDQGGGGSTSSSSSGSTGGSTSSSGSTGGSTSSSSTSSSGTGGCSAPTDCPSACKQLYYCTQQDDLCPGLLGVSWEDFAGGGGQGCMATCGQNPALISLVDQCDCATTLDTLLAVSSELAAACWGLAEPCLTCGEFLTTCQSSGCPNPDQICEGPSAMLLGALHVCLCSEDTCAALCKQSCQGYGQDGPGCQQCQQDAAFGVCSDEFVDCANDV